MLYTIEYGRPVPSILIQCIRERRSVYNIYAIKAGKVCPVYFSLLSKHRVVLWNARHEEFNLQGHSIYSLLVRLTLSTSLIIHSYLDVTLPLKEQNEQSLLTERTNKIQVCCFICCHSENYISLLLNVFRGYIRNINVKQGYKKPSNFVLIKKKSLAS